MADEVETIFVLTEGGSVLAMDLPLSDALADRMASGLISRVNEDGTAYAEAPAPPVVETPAPVEPEVTEPHPVPEKATK